MRMNLPIESHEKLVCTLMQGSAAACMGLPALTGWWRARKQGLRNASINGQPNSRNSGDRNA